ncbi:amino acid permease [Candidatus Woesearchaeota archaeon]|nr:amino acid permease [Candidatus Woesearchaeota archaeon]
MAELNRTLSFPMILIITINSIMGTGIFFLPAIGAQAAGPASILSWLIMSVLAMIIGLIFAELVGMYPKSGGIYEYTKQAFGPFTSFLFGWTTLIAANITIAMLIVGAIRYAIPGLPYLDKIIGAIMIVALFNLLAFKGMRTSAVMLVGFGIVTVGTLLALIIPGIISFDPANLMPFFTTEKSMVFLTVFLIAETFFGWETATFLAEETKDPTKTMPRALWIGTLAIVIISMVFVVVALANIPAAVFGLSLTPLLDLGILHFGASFSPVIGILVTLSILGSVAGWIVAAPRLIMSLAKDKMFISQFDDIHPRYNTPYKAIAFQFVITCILIVAGAGHYETLLELLVPMVLVMYTGVLLSFLIMRFTKKDVARPFRVRGGVFLGSIAILGILALLVTWLMMVEHAWPILRLGLSFIAFGFPVYLLLTYFYNPDVLMSTMNRFTFLNVLLENLIIPKSVRREIVELLPDAEGKQLMEFGSGVGSLTTHLADHVGPRGKVFALELSEHNVRVLKKRMKKRGHIHVETIHDPHMINRIHPGVKKVDMVVSFGNLSYIQDISKVLKEVYDILPSRGRIVFVEYIDMFWVFPNHPEWLSDKNEVRRIFDEAGFAVNVKVKRSLFWKYIYIYGIKEKSSVPFI